LLAGAAGESLLKLLDDQNLHMDESHGVHGSAFEGIDSPVRTVRSA
jgi:hypothetical protein